MVARIVAWVLGAIFVSTDTLPGLDELDTAPRVAKMLREAPGSFTFVVYVSTLLFMVSPLITIGLPVPAFVLGRRQLDTHAYRLARHRIYLVRQSMLMLKTVGGLIWGGHPDVRAALDVPAYEADPGTFRQGGEDAADLAAAGRPEIR